jgi:RNA polymerase sigma-70 factor (ECF subfamily)
MNREPDIGTGTGAPFTFPTTLWTVVLNAGAESESVRRQALEHLIRIYWRPVYFFIRRRNPDREAAKDLTQSYFAAVLERDAFQGLTPQGGKFRSYLLTTVRNFLGDEGDRARALKRGGGRSILPLDFDAVERDAEQMPVDGEHPEDGFRREWALSVIAEALAALRRDYHAEGRGQEFEAFCRHLSYSGDLPSYADLARTLAVTQNDVRNRLHAARSRYAAAILAVLRASTRTSAEADEELRELFAAFQ